MNNPMGSKAQRRLVAKALRSGLYDQQMGMLGFNPRKPGQLPKIPHPDPRDAADALNEVRVESLIKGGPNNFPILCAYSIDRDLMVMGEPGWSAVKCVEWARAFIVKMKARRFELNMVAYCHPSAVSLRSEDMVPCTITVVEDLDRGRAVRGLALTGHPQGKIVTGSDSKLPLDLHIYSLMTADLLKPDDFFIGDRLQEIANRNKVLEERREKRRQQPAQRGRHRYREKVHG